MLEMASLVIISELLEYDLLELNTLLMFYSHLLYLLEDLVLLEEVEFPMTCLFSPREKHTQ